MEQYPAAPCSPGPFVLLLTITEIIRYLFLLVALLQKLVGELFIFGREILWEIWWEFCGIFSDPQKKGSNNSGKFRSIFRERLRALKKVYRATHISDM